MKQYMKLLDVMKSGRRVTVAEIESTLAPTGFLMKRLSSYIWDINHYAKGEVKAEKKGRKVVAYTLTNPEKFKNFKLDVPKAKGEGEAVKPAAKKVVVKPMTPKAPVEADKGAGDVVKAAAKKAVKPKAKKPAKKVATKKATKAVAKPEKKAKKVAEVKTTVTTKPVRVPAAPVKKPTDHVEAAGFDDIELPTFLDRRPDGPKLAEEVIAE